MNIKSTKKPHVFAPFPQDNKIENSEKYYPHNYLGYDFFHSSLEVAYHKNDDKFKLFIMQGNSSEDVKTMLQNYFEFVGLDTAPEQGKIYEIDDTFNGLVILMLNENSIYGVYDTEDKQTANAFLKLLSPE